MKLELSICGTISIHLKHFLPHIVVLENLNLDLEKSWKNAFEKCGNPDFDNTKGAEKDDYSPKTGLLPSEF